MHKARRARTTKPKKARAAKARKPAKGPVFRAHRGKGAGKTFKAHKPLRRVSVFRAHGKRKLKPHGAAAHRVRAAHAKKARVRKMRRASLVLSLIARR